MTEPERIKRRRDFYLKYLTPKQVAEIIQIKSPHIRHKKFLMWTQGNNCQKCGTAENLTIDHIIPVSITKQRREKNLANKQLLCRTCNLEKGSKCASL